jgi:hypothetical protein
MDGLLPVVKSEICCALRQEIESELYWRDQFLRLQNENPCIAQVISRFATGLEDQETAESVTMGAILVYRMLESQAEANRMEDEFKFDVRE